MEENKDGIWLDEMLIGEELNGSEKIWRSIGRIADSYYLTVKVIRYPLTSDTQQYSVYVATYKNRKWVIIHKEQGMVLKEVLQKIEKYLKEYQKKNKKYELGKRGMGGFI